MAELASAGQVPYPRRAADAAVIERKRPTQVLADLDEQGFHKTWINAVETAQRR
jgi:hypothetical protein